MPLPAATLARVKMVRNSTDQLASSMVVPQEVAPVRVPIQTGTERTSLLPLQATGTLTFTSANAGLAQALLFRHPLVPLWITGVFTRAQTQYLAEEKYQFSNTTSVITDNIKLSGEVFWNNPGVTTFPSWFAPTFNASGATQNIPIGRDTYTGFEYFWVPGNGNCYCQLRVTNLGSSSGNISCNLMYWNGAGDELFIAQQATSISGGVAQITYAAPFPGWYRWSDVGADSVSNAGVAIQIYISVGFGTDTNWPSAGGTAVGLWPFNPPPDFGTTSNYPWLSTKTNSSAALFTNVSQVFEKQGTVLAARLIAGDNPWAASQALLSTRTPQEKYFGAFETGLYTWSSPSPESQRYFQCYRSGSFNGGAAGATLFNPLIDLNDTGYYNCITFTDSSTSPYPIIAVTVDWHIEFRSTSPLFPGMVSSTSLEAVHQAHLLVGSLNPFTENPDHNRLHSAIIALVRSMDHPATIKKIANVSHKMQQMVPGSKVPANGGAKGPKPKGKPKPKPKAAAKSPARGRSRSRSAKPKRQ